MIVGMPLVKVLPDILASQVAAGEVVERPASVVKELVENSLDAGAREIVVDIEKGGVGLIRVSDDGSGMAREDALLSLERHATSKLRTSADLGNIVTLGFRGEAVPSIASVSRFRILTKRPEDLSGTEVVVDGGKIRDVRDAGGAPGTVIEARALFFNMPARRKFMRAETTEAAHVEQQVRLHALAAPGVRFRLRKDNKVSFDFPGVAKAVDRVRQMIGNELGSELLSLPELVENQMKVSGFILQAKHARKGRRHQFVFLNGRPVEDPAIVKGLADGFRGRLQEGMQPAAWIWLEIDPKLVDVNVHPGKKEVRFHRPYEIRDLVAKAVERCLKPPAAPDFERAVSQVVSTPEVTNDEPSPERPTFRPLQDELVVETKEPERKSNHETLGFRTIGVLHERYIILESSEGLVLFDPRAGWERILFEKMAKERKAGMETQVLLVPILTELDPRDLDLLLHERLALIEAGLEVEAFGGNTLQVRSVPACIEFSDPLALLDEILHEILQGTSSANKFAFDRLARIICEKASRRIAIRLDEAGAVLEKLFECDLPYCAADGRPTLSEFSRKDIDRRFGNGRR